MSGWWLKIYTCYAFIEGNYAGSDQPRAACPDFPSGDQVYSLSRHIHLFRGYAIWLFLWPEQHHFFRERYVLVTFFFFYAILVIQKKCTQMNNFSNYCRDSQQQAFPCALFTILLLQSVLYLRELSDCFLSSWFALYWLFGCQMAWLLGQVTIKKRKYVCL